jgi:hypothetical protein
MFWRRTAMMDGWWREVRVVVLLLECGKEGLGEQDDDAKDDVRCSWWERRYDRLKVDGVGTFQGLELGRAIFVP